MQTLTRTELSSIRGPIVCSKASKPQLYPACAGRKQERSVLCKYSKEERVALVKGMRRNQVELEEAALANMSPSELKERFSMLGKSTLGFKNEKSLRRLLALRLHKAKAQATRFPLRFVPPGRTSNNKSYITLPVDVEGLGIWQFIIDTGTTGTLISAQLRDELGLSPFSGAPARGLDHRGITLRQKIRLPTLRLGPHQLDLSDGYVTNFELPEYSIGGVLGLRFLASHDVEINPTEPGAFIAFHPVGHAQQGVIPTSGCVPISCSTSQSKGGLVAMNVSLNGCPAFPGIVDLSATYSTINTAAAQFAERERALVTGKVTAKDGTVNTTIRGGMDLALIDKNRGTSYRIAPAPPVLVRDVPVLGVLGLGDQPAMVIGRDILGKNRTVLSLAHNTVWLEP